MSIDSNVLIEAKNRYFQMDIAPGFWAGLDREMSAGNAFVTHGVYREITSGDDDLATWLKERQQYVLDERTCARTQTMYAEVGRAVDNRQPAYRAAAVHKFHAEADPWIIAHALANGHSVVSLEAASPDRITKVSVPDVCLPLGVPCITTFDLLRTLGIRLVLG